MSCSVLKVPLFSGKIKQNCGCRHSYLLVYKNTGPFFWNARICFCRSLNDWPEVVAVVCLHNRMTIDTRRKARSHAYYNRRVG